MSMRCPQCDQEMEGGFLQTLRGLMVWSEKRKKIPFWLGREGEELVAGTGDLPLIPTMVGWRCRNCGLYLVKEERDDPKTGQNPFLTNEQIG